MTFRRPSAGEKSGDAQWSKVLWRKQGYPDDYVPDSFLSELKEFPLRPRPQVKKLIVAALPISQHLVVIALYIAVFHGLLLGRFSAPTVGWTTVFLTLVGVGLRRALDYGRPRSVPKGQSPLAPTTTLKPLVLPPLLLSLLSPVLGTLTSATTSDSIWPLSGGLFFVHLLLADFSTGPRKSRRRGRIWTTATPVVETPNPHRQDDPEEQTLSSSLSLTSALSASVVLASRLPSTAHVFSFILLAVALFAGWPGIAKRVRQSGQGFSFALTLSLLLLAISLFPNDEYDEQYHKIPVAQGPTIALLCVLLTVNLAGPVMLWWGWKWKTTRIGGWDVAKVRVRRNSRHS